MGRQIDVRKNEKKGMNERICSNCVDQSNTEIRFKFSYCLWFIV